MKNYVLDASLILSFLLEEELSNAKKIESLLKDADKEKVKLFSSHLLPLEVGNGLRFTLEDEKLAEEVYEKFLKLTIDYLSLSKVQLQKSLSLSFLLKTTFYDTSYHLLAHARNARFVTCDKDYYEKAKELGNIELLD